jgi:prophage regulatory protein
MKFLLRKDLSARGISFSNKHLLDLERSGRFPKRVRLGAKSVAWSEPEIDEYQARLLAERTTEKAA